MKKIFFFILLTCIASNISANEYHVSKKGNDSNNGSKQSPFLTIKQAVSMAHPGDTITVHQGIYREWINPIRGGESNSMRIVYRAASGEKVEIKGSEVIKGWKREKKGVWKVVIPNSFFGDYNPYKDLIQGDWFLDKGRVHHTGEVFLNGKSLYEKESIEKVSTPIDEKRIAGELSSKYNWYCETTDTHTTIWANFQKQNPNKEVVEISTRKTCFYPENPGINYITIQGFHFSQAATQWAAPTAEQVGMIATHWNKGWLIEDNVISDSKNNGITLGKERKTGHNTWTADEENVNRDGNIHYIETVFNVLRNNWNKENVGSHIVRNNTIFNCEQTAICGSMGAVFSTIENNHIYNINTKGQFEGWELGGIKFHAPIDVIIRNNRIHDCLRGIWLDWMTQGARVSGNLLYRNKEEDLFIEVNHGPLIIDNNILLSPKSISNWSQGTAFIHNLIAGKVVRKDVTERFTPYFLPHSIDMAGLTIIYGGDDRFYNNIFTEPGDLLSDYKSAKLPSWFDGNVYFNQDSTKVEKSINTLFTDYNPNIKLIEKGTDIYLQFYPNQALEDHQVKLISTETLGKAKVPKAAFENPDGSAMIFDTDYFGKKSSIEARISGPFLDIKTDGKPILIWNGEHY